MYDPEVVTEAREEAKMLLVGYPDVWEQTDALIFLKEDSRAKMREHMQKAAAHGKPLSFAAGAAGSCPMPTVPK